MICQFVDEIYCSLGGGQKKDDGESLKPRFLKSDFDQLFFEGAQCLKTSRSWMGNDMNDPFSPYSYICFD